MKNNKNNKAAVEAIRELLANFQVSMDRWVATNGSDEGFHAWFRTQVLNAKGTK